MLFGGGLIFCQEFVFRLFTELYRNILKEHRVSIDKIEEIQGFTFTKYVELFRFGFDTVKLNEFKRRNLFVFLLVGHDESPQLVFGSACVVLDHLINQFYL